MQHPNKASDKHSLSGTAQLEDRLVGRVTRVSANASENVALNRTSIEEKRIAPVKSLFNEGDLDNKPSAENSLDDELALFETLSKQLAGTYRNLESKLGDLKKELHDEAAEKRAQAAAREELASRHSTLLEILPAGVVLLDGKGIVIEANPAATELLGTSIKQQAWVKVIQTCFAPRHDDGHEVSLKDGRRVRIETRSLNDEAGQLILISDLTETRQLQEQVSRTERLGSLGKMVASLAHQIRTPLSTAMLYAGHLRQDQIDDEMRQDCAEKLLARLTHLEHQIRDMLVFAKGETRLAEQLSMPEFFESLRCAAMPILEKHEVDSEWENLSEGQILCNKETLVGACLNLINNSIEAYEQHRQERSAKGEKSPPPSLKLQVTGQESDARREQRYACIQITDNGPGIPGELSHQVTEAFFTTKPQGTGLGLAVVQAVVKAHHGHFSIKSNANGTTASIILPLFQINQTPLNKAV